jgi:hypothetical protein
MREKNETCGNPDVTVIVRAHHPMLPCSGPVRIEFGVCLAQHSVGVVNLTMLNLKCLT